MKDGDITLYVAAYKDADGLPPERTVLASGMHRPIANADIYDDSGDNIAEKNANYCELTALYWIWKNSGSQYVGLEHYRRFFCGKGLSKPAPLTKEQAAKALENCDIILPKKHKVSGSVYSHYAKKHVASDLDECRHVLEEKFPEYLQDFDKVTGGKRLSLYNMFIAKKEIIDGYCSWLFAVLEELEGRIDLKGRDAYQARAIGFIAERLFNVWIEHNKPQIAYFDVYGQGDVPLFKKIRKFFLDIAKTFI